MTPPISQAELLEIAHGQREAGKGRNQLAYPPHVYRKYEIIAQACERWADEIAFKECLKNESSASLGRSTPTEIQKKYGFGITSGMHRKLEEYERRIKSEG